ncbi:MAG: S8 family serine peptidase [Bacteroidetes bacterium]|nr:S8 family serine peptidase [Bacteroidota bacterium]
MKNLFTHSLRSGVISKFFILILITFCLNGAAQTFYKDYQDGKIYVKFKNDVTVNIPVNNDRSVNLYNAPFLNEIRANYDITALSRPYDLNNDFKLLRTFLIEFSGFDKVDEIITELEQNTDFEYVEKVPYYTIDFHPNDTLYNLVNGPANWNWHLDVINAEMAWDITQGSADINVGIVDNAVWSEHPDLEDKIILQRDTYYNNNSSDPPGTGDSSAWSHGTHCAGLAAGHTNNNIGIASIGYNVSIIAVKAANNSNPNGIYGFPGIQWAANNGAHVISMSWGGSGHSQTNQNIVTSIYNMGIVLLASSGNANSNSPHYPSAYNHVISVASTDHDDTKSSFSNYGYTIDICAPGGFCSPGPSGLLSSTYDHTDLGYYDTFYGTSMSCPFAAGLSCLILSINPDLTPDEVEDILESTCVDIDAINPNYAGELGAGRIDAYAAVINTPFSPVAAFSTEVTTILPGTSIDFTDLSEGIPDDWTWVFEGGVPTNSYVQNPTGIEYPTAGTYDVTLTVSNNFGTNELTILNYITVTSTPLPYVNFSANDSSACNKDVLNFYDLTLYDPTAWVWEFTPNTVTFVNGTSANTQNPEVQFDAPGYYTVSLTATNANGSSNETKTDFIFIEGIEIPFSEDFETGETIYFVLSSDEKAGISIDGRAAAPGSSYGLHFQGNTAIGGWSGGPTNTTPEQAWVDNEEFHAQATNCCVDATGIAGVGLTFDLRQTYGIGQTNSWFRVLVNDEQLADIFGESNFNPETNEDPFETKIFDLSAYGNTYFTITFQSACYLSDYFFTEGDNVFVDNIMISNTTNISEKNTGSVNLKLYPNPSEDILNIIISGVDDIFNLSIINMQGQEVYTEKSVNFSNTKNISIDISNLPTGIYVLSLTSDKNKVNEKLIIK